MRLKAKEAEFIKQTAKDCFGKEAKIYLFGYSDDLDFFLNSDSEFTAEAKKAVSGLAELFKPGIDVTYKSPSFYRATINSQDISLKLDFINDVEFHSREFLHNNNYHKIDNERNILSNRLSALQRGAAKDVADILYISFQYEFNWMDLKCHVCLK